MTAVRSAPATLGGSSPLGAVPMNGGVNFSIFSRGATGVDLELYDRVDDAKPSRTIHIDPAHRTYFYWHTFVEGLPAGQIYGYRVSGPSDPAAGLRFNPRKLLL